MVKYELLKQFRDELDSILNDKDATSKQKPTNPLPKPESGDPKCTVCGVPLSNPEHTLCYKHWQEKNKEIEGA